MQRLLSSGKRLAGSGVDVRLGRRTIIAAIAASMLLPVAGSDASGLFDMFNRPATPEKSRARAVSSTSHTAKLAAARSAASPSEPKAGATCDPAKFRVVVDVGHTAESDGATSARNVAEYLFNLHLAQRIVEKLKADGFPETKLLVTGGKARPSLIKRVAAANNLHANLFLSIHHDSVPDTMLENWEFEGKKSHFSDRFSGYSIYVSHDNPDFKTSLAFAELVGKQMKAQGLQYATQYTQPIMGKYRHPLLNKEFGVYSYDHLVVLRSTQMPAVLLEAGSIINRDEELKMDSDEHRNMVSTAVATALKQFCDARSAVVAR